MLRSPAFIDHFQNPRNTGELPPPAVTVEASNPVCGDTIRLSARWEKDRVAAVAYRSRGCAAAIACGSALTELILGHTRDDIKSLKAADIADAVGGLPPESGHAAALCIDAAKLLVK